MERRVAKPPEIIKAGDRARTKHGHEVIVGRVLLDERGQCWIEAEGASESDWLIPGDNIAAVNGLHSGNNWLPKLA